MSVEPALFGFAAIVFAGYAVQTITGFGALLLCVTFGAHLLPIEQVVMLAVPISILQSAYIAVRHRGEIGWKLLLQRVLPLMGAGMAAGFFVAPHLTGRWLETAFAVMVLVLAARDLFLTWRAGAEEAGDLARPIPLAGSVAALLSAGIVHGIYATGGPLLVYAIGREGLSKGAFRSTLSVVWLSLNTLLVGGFFVEGRYTPESGTDLLVLLPALPLGVLVGELLHHRVAQRPFRIAVFVLLIAAALSLLVR